MYVARLEFPAHLSESEVFDLASAFDDITQAASTRRIDQDDDKPWLSLWYFDNSPALQDLTSRLEIQLALYGQNLDLPAPQIEKLEDKNWLEEVYRAHPPFSVGPFFIYGSHFEEGAPDGQIGLMIDAATAFGSGDHGTTKGCIQAMLDLKAKGICPWNILDMGTGSGILAIAAWKLWHTPITAIDNDPEAVRIAEKYQALNEVKSGQGGMNCETGDGFNAALCAQKKPYELILANILAGPLIEMAPELKAVCDKPGYVILSGMLTTQADDVQAAYEAQSFTLKKRIDIGKWSTLSLQCG